MNYCALFLVALFLAFAAPTGAQAPDWTWEEDELASFQLFHAYGNVWNEFAYLDIPAFRALSMDMENMTNTEFFSSLDLDRSRRIYAEGGLQVGHYSHFTRNKKYRWSLGLGLQVWGSTMEYPNALTEYEYMRQPFYETREVEPFTAAHLSAVDLSFEFAKPGVEPLGWRIRAKVLLPVMGGFFESTRPFQLEQFRDGSLEASDLTMNWYDLTIGPERSSQVGGGFGASIGGQIRYKVAEIAEDNNTSVWLDVQDIGFAQINRLDLRSVNTDGPTRIMTDSLGYRLADNFYNVVEETMEDFPEHSKTISDLRLLLPARVGMGIKWRTPLSEFQVAGLFHPRLGAQQVMFPARLQGFYRFGTVSRYAGLSTTIQMNAPLLWGFHLGLGPIRVGTWQVQNLWRQEKVDGFNVYLSAKFDLTRKNMYPLCPKF